MPSTSILLDVLRCLNHDGFVSGEAVAARLGCSRATVHNAVQEAGRLGVVIHAVPGRGYRLAGAVDWLRPEALAVGLEPLGLSVHYADQMTSTNSFLLDLARNGGPHRAVAITEWQTAGRGRRGRSWLAPLGNGLTFSLLWRSARPAVELSGLSLAVGVILVKALRALGLVRAAVKWPNDIVVERAKLAGVLIELTGDMLGPSVAVIGVGINIRGGSELGRALDQPVTDLSTHLGSVDRNTLFLDLVSRLDDGLKTFEQKGFAAFQADWNASHAYADAAVNLLTGQGSLITGRARGVDASGALLLETTSGLRLFHSGEVSLRGAGL
jgi:BirA family biotin operon repressor/biotin-[acetyl-CoA-carboxylase] ligase